MDSDRQYDLIVIGSGMGALTVASLMAQLRGKRVLVLERHFRAGGFTHAFQRQGFHWDVGVHYIGQMGEGMKPRQLFDLVTQRGVQWQKMPEVFETFVYPGLSFEVPANREVYEARLIQEFPAEAAAIRRYFRDVPRAAAALSLLAVQRNSSWVMKALLQLGRWWMGFDMNLTTQAYLDRHFTDARLKGLLASQWLDYGLPPSQSPFAVHAMVVNHYLEGAYYPVGGAGTIAQTVQPVIESYGGRVLVNREVQEILVEKGRAIGVRVANRTIPRAPMEETYYAPVIVSNAGAANTYLKLVPPQVPIPFRESLRQFVEDHPPATHVSLYVGFKDDPRKLGFAGENHWIYEQFDHEAIASNWLQGGSPQQIYLSFPSLKDPKAKKHTAELIALVDYDCFLPWKSQSWLHRDAGYQTLKLHIQRAMLDLVEKHYPGFNEQIAYVEVSTPLTNEHFTAHPKGAIYGLPAIAQRYNPSHAPWTSAKTPISGLYLTGVDLCMGGVVSALFSGLMTLNQLPNGVRFPEAFAIASRQSGNQTVPVMQGI